MKEIRAYICGFFVLLLFIFGCRGQTETVKIGVVLPLTGTASIHGQNTRQGIDLAVEEINANGGIAGKPIELIYEDDQTKPTNTLSAVKKLIGVDNVEVIVGGTWDILANAVIPEIDKKKIVMLSPSALPDTLTETSPYFFSVHSPVSINQEAVEWFIETLPGKTIGILVVNNPWGLAHLAMFKKAIENTDATLVKDIVLQNFDNNDLSTELTQLKDLDVDAIFAALNFVDMALLGKKRIELDIDSVVLAHSNFASTIKAGRLPIETAEGVVVFRFSESSQPFTEAFSAKYGKAPEIYSDIAYDTVYVIKKAIEAHGPGSENIIEGLRELQFTGASGDIHFGNNNYPLNKQPVLEKISDGVFVNLE